MEMIGAYSKAKTLAQRDGRTREGRYLRAVTREMVQHVGGNPSATERVLIDQAAQLRLRLAIMDKKFADTGDFTDHDRRSYLAFANSLTWLIHTLGLRNAAKEKAPSLSEYLAAGRQRGDTPYPDTDSVIHP
jgi:hypothetical protein